MKRFKLVIICIAEVIIISGCSAVIPYLFQ